MECLASSQEDLCKEPKTIHVLELVKDDMELLHQITVEHLKSVGAQVPLLKRRESRAKSRTPGPATATDSCLQTLVEVTVKSHNVTIEIPKFLPLMCNFIMKNLNEQGLFRIAGSSARTNSLISRLDQTEIVDVGASVFDVCSALKQLIRKMEVPIIPPNLHTIFLRCLEFPVEQRNESIFLCVFLLPKLHLHILFYLMEFLHEVTKHSKKNKMDAKNLAIVFAPNIMPLTSIPAKKSGKDSDDSSCGDLINNHVEIVKILIEGGDRLGIASTKMAGDLVAAICRNSEEELDDDGDLRKRKRSSSLNRALNSAAGVLEFICKKRTRKNAQTPSNATAQGYCTPGEMCTPVIRPLSRKGIDTTAATPLSTSTKNRIMLMMNKKKYIGQTPSRSGSMVHQSPAISLNPRPVVTEDLGSVSLKTATPRIGRTMQRANATKNLPQSTQVPMKDKSKSTMQILPLAKSPRKISPRQICKNNSPEKRPPPAPPSTPDYDLKDSGSPDVKQARTEEPGNESERLRFTPMYQGIKELTLAALQEESPISSVQKSTPPSNTVPEENDPVAMSVESQCDAPVQKQKKTVRDGDRGRKTRSTTTRTEARRCHSFNDAYRARPHRTGHIPRRQSDVTATTLTQRRGKIASSSVPPSPAPISGHRRKTAQSLVTLNRSPTRCTLRRGRPNTTRVGLPRPSPVNKGHGVGTPTHSPALALALQVQPQELTPTNITINRKGRVSKRGYTRPALFIPSNNVAEENKRLESKDPKIVKPPSTIAPANSSATTSKHSPKKMRMISCPTEEPVYTEQKPVAASYVSSKLQEVSGSVNFAATPASEVVITIPPTIVTTPSGRKGRSASMRSDMIRPSPNTVTGPYRSLSRKPTSCYETSGDNVKQTEPDSSTPKLMKRGSSVQELVKKFDSNDVITKPNFATLRRESRIGRIQPPNFNIKKGGSVVVEQTKGAPPAKPPRTSLVENLNNAYGAKIIKQLSTKQGAQFTTLTRSANYITNVGKGSTQVLKTINLA